MLRSIIFKIALGLWFVLWSPALLVALITPGLTRLAMLRSARVILWLARVIAGIRYEVIGAPAPNAIIASKHMSLMDTTILPLCCPNVFFIIKRELTWIPIYGWVFRRLDFIGVDRRRGATNMKALADMAAGRIGRGMTLIIFPEGTRVRPGAGVNLRRGLLFIAETAGIGIQPVGLDTGRLWPKRGRVKGGVAHVWFEKPLPPDATLDEVAQAIALHSA